MTERFTRVQTQNLQADEVLNFCCLSMPKHTKESQRVETPPLVWTPLSPQQCGPDLKGTNQYNNVTRNYENIPSNSHYPDIRK
jgi:hypothetical protein